MTSPYLDRRLRSLEEYAAELRQRLAAAGERSTRRLELQRRLARIEHEIAIRNTREQTP